MYMLNLSAFHWHLVSQLNLLGHLNIVPFRLYFTVTSVDPFE